MPATARREQVREGEVGVYHVWTRTAQQEFLLRSLDDVRRFIVQSLLQFLGSLFAIDIGNYVILENHLHLILRTRPDLVLKWTDEMVAWRWKMLWPFWNGERWVRNPTDADVRALLGNPEKLAMARKALSSLSWFMARLKEPLSKLFNAESGKKGHMWEGRFKCRELDVSSGVTCSLYLDLNLLRAGMADSLETSNFSGIQDRLLAHAARQLFEQLLEDVPHAEADPAVMETLARDCFLAPITTTAPLLLDPYGQPLSSSREPATAAIVIVEPAAEEEVVVVVVADSDAEQRQPCEQPCEQPVERPVERPVEVPKAMAMAPTGADGVGDAEAGLGAAGADADEAPVIAEAEAGEAHDEAGSGEAVRWAEEAVERPAAVGSSTSGPTAGRRRRGRPGVVKPKKTWTIHERLKGQLRERASDNGFLPMPLEQYLALAQWAATQLAGGPGGPGPPERPPDELAARLRGLGIIPEKWLEAVLNFHRLFRRAAGRAETLARHAAHGGRRWLHGQRNCAAHFT